MASSPTLNGARVTRADADLPQEGVWTADVACDLAEVPARGALELLGVTYRGAVARGDLIGGTCHLRLVGGTGGLLPVLEPKAYRNVVTVGAVLEDIAREAGETLASTCDPDLLVQTLARWTRIRAPARDQLAHLLQHVGATWRVLPGGTLWAGRYAWPEAPAAPEGSVLTGGAPQDGRRTVAAEVAPWEPGQALQGWRIGAVRHFVRPEASRTVLVEFQPGLGALVQGELARAGLPFAGPLPGKAVVQDADGTLQVQPDDPRWPPLTGVPIRLGLPDAQVTISPGARVLLEWESPEAPAVTAWGASSATAITLGGSSAVAAARLGDAVGLGTLVFATAGPGVLTGTYTPPGGAPLPFTLGTVIPLTGKITSGSPLLKVR